MCIYQHFETLTVL